MPVRPKFPIRRRPNPMEPEPGESLAHEQAETRAFEKDEDRNDPPRRVKGKKGSPMAEAMRRRIQPK